MSVSAPTLTTQKRALCEQAAGVEDMSQQNDQVRASCGNKAETRVGSARSTDDFSSTSANLHQVLVVYLALLVPVRAARSHNGLLRPCIWAVVRMSKSVRTSCNHSLIALTIHHPHRWLQGRQSGNSELPWHSGILKVRVAHRLVAAIGPYLQTFRLRGP